MKTKQTILVLGVIGLLFSGYLSAVKLFTTGCAFNESCPYFLGYPACYYGFVMYLLIVWFAIRGLRKEIEEQNAYSVIRTISFLGILFAGYFTIGELPVLFERGLSAFMLGLPTCSYGLILYILLFILAIRVKE